jgi:hypothetical protein
MFNTGIWSYNSALTASKKSSASIQVPFLAKIISRPHTKQVIPVAFVSVTSVSCLIYVIQSAGELTMQQLIDLLLSDL